MSEVKAFLKDKTISKDIDVDHLLVAHNLTLGELVKTLTNYNGLLAPSLAVIPMNTPYTKYGDISLIFDQKSLFNGDDKTIKSDSTNNVYSSDIYSVRFPETSYDYKKRNLWKLYDEFESYMQITEEYAGDWEYKVNKGFDTCVNKLSDMAAVKLAFIKENMPDIQVGIPTKKVPFSHMLTNTVVMKRYLRSGKIGTQNFNKEEFLEVVKKACDEFIEKKVNNPNLQTSLKNYYPKKYKEIFDNMMKVDSDSGLKNKDFSDLTRDIKKLKGDNTKIDYRKLQENLEDLIIKRNLKDEYQDYVESKARQLYDNPHIKMGSKKLEVTEENILYFMRRSGVLGTEETLTYGLGKTKSQFAKKFTSLASVYDHRDMLTSREDHLVSNDKNKDLLMEISDRLYKDKPDDMDTFELNDFISKYVGGIGRLHDDDKVIRQLKQKGFSKVDYTTADKILELSKNLKEEKVEYFEAKPLRKVHISEIKGVVLPRNVPQEVKDLLKDVGIKELSYYQLKSDNDRVRATNKMKKFAISEKSLKKQKLKKNKI